jgi:RHS repeat-associated protein
VKILNLAVILSWNQRAPRAASCENAILCSILALLFCMAPGYARAQSSQVTPNNQTGIVSYNTYAGDHENVNLATSDLNVALPLVSLPGRNHHDVTLSLLYDSHQWELSAVVDPVYGFLGYSWTLVDGGGWRLNAPRLSGRTFHCDSMGDFWDTYWGDFIVTLPSGDKHHFSNTANHVYHQGACDGPITGGAPPGQSLDYSADGSLLKFDTSSADAILRFKDGSSLVFYAYLGAANQVDWKDSNGNIITYLFDSNGNLVSVTDSVGRVISVSSGGISYPDGSGVQRTIAFGYSNQTLAPTFSLPPPSMASNPTPHTASILSSVTLANTRSYTMQYNSFGELTKITYPAGGYTRYAYGALPGWYQLSQDSTSGDVRVVTNSYSCANASGSCTAGEERLTTYSATRQQFDSNNTAITVTDALGNYTTYTFSNAGALPDFSSGAAPIPPRELSRTLYDSSGKMWRSIATNYNTVSYWYGTSNFFPIRRTTTLDDGKVSKTEWDYDTLSFAPSLLVDNVVEERVFDYGSLSVPAVKRRFTYLKVNPVNGVDYQSTLFVLDLKASEQVYDSHTGSDVLMAQSTSEYDSYTAGLSASGATKHDPAYATGYTTRGNVTAVNHWRNTDSVWLTSRNQYDDAGNVLSTADPLGHLSQFSYADNFTDGINHNGKAYATQTTYPATGSVSHIERKQYFYGGLLAASCGQNFPITSACANTYTLPQPDPPQPDYAKYSYDAMNRLVQVTMGDGGGKTITYNDVPPFSSTTNVPITSGTSGISLTTAATMDGLGRTTQTRLTSDPLGTDYTDTVYDALGRAATVSNPYRSTSDPTYGVIQNQYDGLGRVTRTTRQDGSVNTVSYAGPCATTTDEAGKQRKACSDALGRLTNVWEDPAGLNYETDYQYDVLGNLLRVDQKGSAPADSSKWRTRLFTYNSLSQLLTANNPESGTITYAYDNDGELLMKTSPAANQTNPSVTQTVSYCYDELHRVSKRDYQPHVYNPPACPITAPVVSYVYDVGDNAKGHLTSLIDQAGTASYAYEILGRLVTETRSLTGANNVAVNKTISYSYNLDGSVNTLTYPSGKVVTYTPWHNGALGVSVPQDAKDQASGINYVTGATYGPDGSLNGFVSGNSPTFAGITNTFSYNKRLQPLTMSATFGSPLQTVFSIGYDFHFGNGDNGNVWGITNNKDTTRNQTFTYDPLNRLISAQNAGTDCNAVVLEGKKKFWGNNYIYDAWGNLTTKALTQTPIPACSGEGLSVSVGPDNRLGSGYLYDAAGNMTFNATPPTQSYTWDQENRLTGAAGYTYTYDADGNRVRKSNGDLAASGTLYWYMTPGVVAESDLAGTLKSEYVFFDGERVARRDGATGTGGVFYYFSDHLKTASVITDSSGVIKAESDYYPWGGELQFVNNDSNDYKFTGKKRDVETGLDYFGARYYSNGLGRWVSADWSAAPVPVPYANFGDPQSLNLYGYVRNIPTTGMDADGHECTVATPQCAAYSWLAGKIEEGIDAAKNAMSGPELPHAQSPGLEFMKQRLQQCPCPANQKQEDSKKNNNNNSNSTNQQESGGQKTSPNGTGKTGTSGGPRAGKPMTPKGKAEVKAENAARNGGQTTCERCGQPTGPAEQSKSGVTPPGNETHVDHIDPMSKGGDGSPSNGQVLCRTCNLEKGDKVPPR